MFIAAAVLPFHMFANLFGCRRFRLCQTSDDDGDNTTHTLAVVVAVAGASVIQNTSVQLVKIRN